MDIYLFYNESCGVKTASYQKQKSEYLLFYLKKKKRKAEGWGCSLVVKRYLNISQALGSVLSTQQNNNKTKKTKKEMTGIFSGNLFPFRVL